MISLFDALIAPSKDVNNFNMLSRANEKALNYKFTVLIKLDRHLIRFDGHKFAQTNISRRKQSWSNIGDNVFSRQRLLPVCSCILFSLNEINVGVIIIKTSFKNFATNIFQPQVFFVFLVLFQLLSSTCQKLFHHATMRSNSNQSSWTLKFFSLFLSFVLVFKASSKSY
jgi:hypothetical protein